MKAPPTLLERPGFADETDAALMDRVRADDDLALGAIIERYRGRLVSYAFRMVKTVDAAEEIVQETFVRFWEIRKRWAVGGSVQAYLYRTARNLALARVRHLEVRERSEPEIRRSLLEVADPSPLDEAVEAELLAALQVALERLAPRRREALLFVRFHGLSLDEAAARMGLSRQTVANHISLALDDLEEVLKDYRD